MANWNEIKSGVGRAANKTIKKAGEIADAASMKLKLKTLNVKLTESYETLGRLTYKQIKTERSQAEDISKVIERIDKYREDIKKLKKEIEDAKKERELRPEDVKIEDDEDASDDESDETEDDE
jgi:cob(I)alamin adenosyltransferase